ncbi:MAG: HdeD family acid-resistance protein [Acidobacteriota bacterium]
MAARDASLDKMNIEYDINPNITQSIQMHVFQKNWGWFHPGGIAVILLGMTAISLSAVTTLDIEYLLGSILVVSGIVQYIGALRSRGWGEFFPALLIAIHYASVGIILLKYQVGAVHSLTLFLTAYLMVEGILKIARAFLLAMAGWGWVLFSGILAFLVGALIFSQWPTSPAWVVSLLVGLDLLSSGWSIVMIELAAPVAPSQ